jgi:ATP-independent RNA helicase DbpA
MACGMRRGAANHFHILAAASCDSRWRALTQGQAWTPIQAQALPAVLEGRDLIAQAPTGSGKTAAFGLGLLQGIDATATRTQALVLCPTRELADQVGKQLRKLATGIANLKLSVLCGGIPLGPQLASLTHAPHVVVGTPGRVLELVQKEALDLRKVRTLVLDEADRMLDMGFDEPIRALVKRTPKERQTLLFSATFPDSIRTLAKAMLREPLEVSVDGGAQPAAIRAHFFEADAARRAPQLAALLLQFKPESTVVFCNMRRDTEEVVGSLAHRVHRAGLARRHGTARSRRSAGALRQPQLQRAGRQRRRRARAGHRRHRRGGELRTAHRCRYSTCTASAAPVAPAAMALALSLVASGERNARCIDRGTPGCAGIRYERVAALEGQPRDVPQAAMATLRIDAGRTDKLRPGDIVGALTGDAGLPKEAIGKIDVFATRSYVAIRRKEADKALARLQAGKIKGRKLRVSRL